MRRFIEVVHQYVKMIRKFVSHDSLTLPRFISRSTFTIHSHLQQQQDSTCKQFSFTHLMSKTYTAWFVCTPCAVMHVQQDLVSVLLFWKALSDLFLSLRLSRKTTWEKKKNLICILFHPSALYWRTFMLCISHSTRMLNIHNLSDCARASGKRARNWTGCAKFL